MNARLRSPLLLSLLLLSVAKLGCSDSDDSNASGGAAGSGASGGSAGSGGSAASAGSGGAAGGGAAGAAGSGGSAGLASIDCTAGDIVAYRFGNQITGSTLQVSSTGIVVHSERTCCPPTETDQNAPPLDAPTLVTLKGWVEAAKAGTVLQKDGTATVEGSTSGTLEACAADGTPVIVRNVIRSTVSGGLDAIFYNTSSEAEEIRVFVTNIVDQDMPGG